MEVAFPRLRLENATRPDLKGVEAEATADSGAIFLCIPEQVRAQLQLEPTSTRQIVTADGKRSVCPYVGPIRAQFGNRECYVGAVVVGDRVLLGLVPMEDMDLVVILGTGQVAVNPLHPNFARGLAK